MINSQIIFLLGIIGQGILLLSLFLISHYAGDTVLAQFAQLYTLSAFLGTFLSLRLELNLPTVGGQDAIKLFTNSILTVFILSILTVVIFYIFSISHFYAIILGSLQAITNIITYLLIRKKNFNFLGGIKVVFPIVFVVIIIISVFTQKSLSGEGLIVAISLGYFITIILFFDKTYFSFKQAQPRLMRVWKQYRLNTVFTSTNNAADLLKDFLIIFALTEFYGTRDAATYFLVSKLFFTPMALLGNACSQVFYADLASNFNANRRKYYAKKIGKFILLGVVLIFSIVTATYWLQIYFLNDYYNIWQLVILGSISINIFYLSILSVFVLVCNLQKQNLLIGLTTCLITVLLVFIEGSATSDLLAFLKKWLAFLCILSFFYTIWINNEIKK